MPVSSSEACSTTAAQPSPNSTATLRFSQSMNGEIVSTPTTSAFFTVPARISALAVDSPYRKLVHAVLTSIAPAFHAPSRNCSPDAVLGTASSLLAAAVDDQVEVGGGEARAGERARARDVGELASRRRA